MKTRSTLAAALLFAGALAWAGVARADTLVLRDGSQVHGRVVSTAGRDYLFQTEEGTLRFPKADVVEVLVEEDPLPPDAEAHPGVEPREAAGAAAPRDREVTLPASAARPRAEDEAPPPPTVDELRGAWRWAAALGSREVARLEPVRDQLLAELAALGPSREARLASIAVGEGEAEEIRLEIHNFGYRQLRGSAILVRRNRKNALLAEHGLEAIPFLVDALSRPRYWSMRVAAQALRDLAHSGEAQEARWFLYHFGAPGALILQFGRGPEASQVGLREDLLEALRAITGEGFDTQEEWSDWWREEQARWRRAEEERRQRRRELLRELELVRVGVVPPRLQDEG